MVYVLEYFSIRTKRVAKCGNTYPYGEFLIKEVRLMFAIIETGGKQYKVSEGDVVFIERLDAEEGADISFDSVLAVGEGAGITIGNPVVSGAVVNAKVLKNAKAKKVVVFKYKPKKGYRKKQGHRQPYTKVQIEKINA